MKIGGKELGDIREADLMKNITYVSHQSYLFKGTVRDNLLMGKPGASDEELRAVLERRAAAPLSVLRDVLLIVFLLIPVAMGVTGIFRAAPLADILAILVTAADRDGWRGGAHFMGLRGQKQRSSLDTVRFLLYIKYKFNE